MTTTEIRNRLRVIIRDTDATMNSDEEYDRQYLLEKLIDQLDALVSDIPR